MENFLSVAEHVSLFCRLNMNASRDLPIRSSEMGMLIFLCKTAGVKTPKDIARFFTFSKAMATNMVTSMLKEGYIKKQISIDDHRSSFIMPTDKAYALVELAYVEYFKSIQLLRDDMGLEDFSKLVSLLEQANTILLKEKHNGK